MNEKHAREARIMNRVAGFMVKKGVEATFKHPQTGQLVQKPHKLPRQVKRNWDQYGYRQRAKLSIHWRSGVAFNIKLSGGTPKGDLPKLPKTERQQWREMSRSRRKAEHKANAKLMALAEFASTATQPWEV